MYDVHNEMMNSDTPWLGLFSYYYTILLTLTRKQITSFCPDKFFYLGPIFESKAWSLPLEQATLLYSTPECSCITRKC
jgi:hypothetical protein